MNTPKRYRVIQYAQLSELGLVFVPGTPPSRNVPREVWRKDYRWRWVARFVAMMSRGESAGLGLRLLTAEIVDLDQEEPRVE
ncbi:hypothetical protein QEH42_gp176 [Microbacterium phage Pumpernickel]|uniref:Uncharacterized protein n=1 Tax=Microbacterium phage Pumpernickel TaxID=2885983 RepID=A0AAE8Y7X7_9CAUD|nr:hypothetical protein QEH42_gp176 [Microbacterium phage Pumpernickel]UDL16042.1 hypothetical protein SEA_PUMPERNICKEL_292 [Microbacterium phage Pumpernickel]